MFSLQLCQSQMLTMISVILLRFGVISDQNVCWHIDWFCFFLRSVKIENHKETIQQYEQNKQETEQNRCLHAHPVLFLTRTNSFRFAYRPFHLVCGRSVFLWLIFQKLMLFSSITLALSSTNIARAYISIFNVHVTAHECRHNHKQF